jgi:polyhydroxyalkanoate synthesis regulator phasin
VIGRVQREEAKAYVQSVVERAAQQALRAIADVVDREQLTRQDAELLLHDLLPSARWTAQEASYTPQRLWEQDPAGYARAFAMVAATILAAERASVQRR